MFTAAGYFCTQCSTVIIDEDFVKQGITGGFPFYTVAGISPDGDEHTFFETFNGATSLFILDEEGHIVSLVPYDEQTQDTSASKSKAMREKVKRSRKLAKAKRAQRKKNRKRK